MGLRTLRKGLATSYLPTSHRTTEISGVEEPVFSLNIQNDRFSVTPIAKKLRTIMQIVKKSKR